MRSLLLLAVLVAGAVPLQGADPLADARRLYNQGQYDDAERAAAGRAAHSRQRGGRAGRPRPDSTGTPSAVFRAGRALRRDRRAHRGRCAPARRARANRADGRPRRSAVSRGSIRPRGGAVRVGARRVGDARPGGARPRAGLVGDGPRSAGAEPAVRRAAGALCAPRRPHGRGNREGRRIAARRILAGGGRAGRRGLRPRAERGDRRLGARPARRRPRGGASRGSRSPCRRGHSSRPGRAVVASKITPRRSPAWSPNGRRSRRAGRR